MLDHNHEAEKKTTPRIASCIRVITIDLDGGINASPALVKKVSQFTDMYLSKNWGPPEIYTKLEDLSYILKAADNQDIEPARVDKLRDNLEEYLFGTDAPHKVYVLSLTAPEPQIIQFASESADRLFEARQGSDNPVMAIPKVTDPEISQTEQLPKTGAVRTAMTSDPNLSDDTPKMTIPKTYGDIKDPKDQFMRFDKVASSQPLIQVVRNNSDDQETPEADSTMPAEATPTRTYTQNDIFFRAILETRSQTLLSFMLSLSHPSDPSREIDLIEIEKYYAAKLEDNDRHLLIHGFNILNEQIEAGNSGILLIPVNYETFSTPSNVRSLFDICDKIPVTMRKFLAATVYNTPKQPLSSITEMICGQLQHYFRFVDWQTDTQNFEPERFRGSRLHSVTLRLPDNSEQSIPMLENFLKNIEALHQMKVRASIANLSDPAWQALSTNHGVNYLCGAAISELLPPPVISCRVNLDDLPVSNTTHALGSQKLVGR